MTTVFMVVALCLVTSAATVMFGRRLVERANPATVVPLLAIGSLVNAVSLGVLLTLLGLAVAGRAPDIASAVGWSPDRLETALPVPTAVGLVAGVAALTLVVSTLWRAGRIVGSLLRSDRLSRRLRAGGPPIVMIDDNESPPDAYTLAGLRGCVVISRPFFDALAPDERKMLTGHELSHLRRRHHLYVHAVDLAVAANPSMLRIAEAVRLGVERWADEDAVRILAGDRLAAASALAGTALTRSRLRRAGSGDQGRRIPIPVLGVATSQVTERARALLAPAPRRSALTASLAVLLVATCAAAIASALHLHDGFESAEIIRQFARR